MNSKSPPSAPAVTPLRAPDTPYRGLTPYSEQDAAIFFGREAECELVIANMMASRLTVMYGASGVGKTSLLRAGVAHELRERSQRNVGEYGSPEFVVVYFNRWSDDPVLALTRRIHESARAFASGELDEPPIGSMGLAETVHWWTTILDADLLIILDQVEEYFLYHPEDDDDDSFAVEFPRAVNRADLRVSFLITIREDALARLDRFKGRCPNLFDNYLRTRHLDITAARAAIEKPLAAYNELVSPPRPFTAEPALVELVLDQVQIGRVVIGAAGRGVLEQGASPTFTTQRVETPYLQLVLTRLWLEEIAVGSFTLRAETLRRLGGAQQIVHTHLDEALGALSARQQDVAAGVFHHLVTASGTKIAHTAPDLADYAQLPEAEVAEVLADLSRGDVRILRPVAPSSAHPDADPAYEIFHDVLAPTILDWWTRHTEARAAEARLGAQLELSAEQTRAAEERAHHYRQWLKRVSVVALVLLLALVSTVAIVAVRGQRAAVKAQGISHSKALAAEAVTSLGIDPASSLRLALAAMQEDPNREAASALRRALSEPEVRILRGHRNWVTSATFSPDGHYVLTSSQDSTVRVWSASSGRQLAILRTAKPPYFQTGKPQLSRDGNLILVNSTDGKVEVWPWRTGSPPTVVSSGDNAVRAAFSPDGDHVVTGHRDGTTRVWAWRARRLLAVLPANGDEEITTVAFSPDGKFVATGGDNGTVRLWRWRAPGGPLMLAGHKDYIKTITFSPAGGLLLTSSYDGTARLFAVPGGRLLAVMHGGNPGLNSAAFSPDGRLAVTAGVDKTARVFAVPSGLQVAVLRGHVDELEDAAFSPNGKLVATASADGTAALWNVHTGEATIVLRGHGGTVWTVAFRPDGRSLVTASEDGTARVWTVPIRQVFGGGHDPLNTAAFSPEGRFVATAGEDGTIRIYQAGNGRQVAVLGRGGGPVDSAVFSPDGRRIVAAGLTADYMGIVRIWNVAAPHEGKVMATDPEEIQTAAFSQDGHLLVTSTPSKAVIWDVRTGQRRTVIRLPASEVQSNLAAAILGASLSPDGRWVLTFHYDAARLWSAATGRLVRVLRANAGVVYGAAFSRDGSRMVTANGDGTALVWDPATGRQLHRLVSPSGQLRSVAFSRDGQWVAAGADDGSVTVWNVADEQVAAVLQQHAQAVMSVEFSADGKSIMSASDDGTAVTSACDSCRPMKQLLPAARARVHLIGGGASS
jgi:WD40 repeat protein